MSISVRRISDSPRGPRPATARARTDERAAGAAEAARDAAAGAVYTATAGFGGGAVTLAADGSVLVGHASPGRGDRRRPMSARAAGARSPGGTPRATLPPHRLSLEAEAAAARARLLSRGARASADAHARAVGVGLRGSTLRPRARARPQSARAHWTGFARCARRCPAPARGGPALPPRRPCSPPPGGAGEAAGEPSRLRGCSPPPAGLRRRGGWRARGRSGGGGAARQGEKGAAALGPRGRVGDGGAGRAAAAAALAGLARAARAGVEPHARHRLPNAGPGRPVDRRCVSSSAQRGAAGHPAGPVDALHAPRHGALRLRPQPVAGREMRHRNV